MTAPNPLSPYRTIDATPVRAHLHSIGVDTKGHHAIADLSGVSASTIKQILHGRRNRPQRTVYAATARKLLAVTDVTMTDATGTRRRIRALYCDGYDTARIGAELDVPTSEVRTWLRSLVIAASYAERIADLHQRWAGTAAEVNGSSPADADAARAMARRRRWRTADCWDGDINDPNAAPLVRPRSKRTSEELVAQAELVRACTTFTWRQIAAELGVAHHTLDQARTRVAARRRANSMKPTDAPVPHGVPQKPPVGGTFGNLDGAFTDLPPEVTDKAMRTVAARAMDADDARLLLEAVGLIAPAAPRRRPRKGVPA